ncbi:Transcription termination/antitermination protein NusG [bacterium HR26]|nr:Transcription termination/antitermination protein NusG [bacterium HR26]
MARTLRERLAQKRASETEAEKPGQWYVIHTYSGYENKVRQNLLHRIETMDVADKVFEVVVPTHEEVEIRGGQRHIVQRKVFPGYVLVRMILDDESWHVVRNTPGVTGFVGVGTRPVPLDDKEAEAILKGVQAEAPKVKVSLVPGDVVRIIDGPFTDFRGVIDEVDYEKGKVKVLVSFFGRETPVTLDFLQVERET